LFSSIYRLHYFLSEVIAVGGWHRSFEGLNFYSMS